MKSAIPAQAIEQLFSGAHTAHAFVPREVSEEAIEHLYDTMKWGPTAFNASPARFVFLRTQAAKRRLIPALSSGNVPLVKLQRESPNSTAKRITMRKEYDFSKARGNPYAARLKSQIPIRLDSESIEYFKGISEQVGIPYQSLINLYLRDCATRSRKLDLRWK